MIDWERISSDYIHGNISMRKLAETNGVSFSAIKDHAKKENWGQLRTEYRLKVGAAAAELLGGEETELALILRISQKVLLAAIKLLERGDTLTSNDLNAIMNVLVKAKEVQSVKMALDQREQLAKVALLEKQTEVGRNPEIRIVFEDNVAAAGI